MARIKADDLFIGYEARGEGSTALIFLHGVGSDKALWLNQLDYFSSLFNSHNSSITTAPPSRAWRVVAMDYPGYGESDLPRADLNRKQVAHYILRALDELGVERAHVIGLSMGGVIALEMWRQQPQRILSLTLADTFARHTEGDLILKRSRQALEMMTMRELAEQRIAAILHTKSQNLKRAVIENMARINPRSYFWASSVVWTANLRMELSRINLPTLVLVGEHDTVTPLELSKELQEGIKDAQMIVIPDAGHLSNLDNPSAFNCAIQNFLNQITHS